MEARNFIYVIADDGYLLIKEEDETESEFLLRVKEYNDNL